MYYSMRYALENLKENRYNLSITCKKGVERIEFSHLKKETLNDVYREIAELVGMDNMSKLYEFYRGQQVSFPTRLYRKEFLREVIEKKYDGTNAKEISRELGYSERWIKEVAKQIKNI